MSEIDSTFKLQPPHIPFTLPKSFKGMFNGFIYGGKVDATDPVNNQIQAYVQEEDGSLTEIAQPIKTNSGGFPVYNGMPATILFKEPYSLIAFDKNMVQQWYVPNMNVSGDASQEYVNDKVSSIRKSSFITFATTSDAKSVPNSKGIELTDGMLIYVEDTQAEYIVKDGTTSYPNIDPQLSTGPRYLKQILKNYSLEFSKCGVTTGDSTVALQEIASRPERKIVMDVSTEITSPWNLQNGTTLDMCSNELFCNHDGLATANTIASPLDMLTIKNGGTLRSKNGIDGSFISGNTALLLTNARIDRIKLVTWGEDGVSARGGCVIDLIEFDDIRDNPYTTIGDDNVLAKIIGGSCAGDFVLLKGNRNTVEYAKAKGVGFRDDQNQFTAGSAFIIGADGDPAEDCHIEYGEVEQWGGLLVGTEGNNNTFGVIKGGTSFYDSMYPVGGGQRKVEVINLSGNGNSVREIYADSSPRGVGIGGTAASSNEIQKIEVGDITVANFINIDRTDNKDTYIGRAVVGNVPNSDCIRIIGESTRIGTLLVKNGTGGGNNAFGLTGDKCQIEKLEYNADPASSGNGGRFSGNDSWLGRVKIKGFKGFALELAGDIQVDDFDLENSTGAYDSILKATGGNKFSLCGGKVNDVTGTKPPAAFNNAVVVYANNISPDMTQSSGTTVTNSNNI